ncbi:hypothetical protein BS78_08G010700 [Paspalum vaginatum]|nr:hypothetical protein BS78_08G010700 [Paspalum vaginatum]
MHESIDLSAVNGSRTSQLFSINIATEDLEGFTLFAPPWRYPSMSGHEKVMPCMRTTTLRGSFQWHVTVVVRSTSKKSTVPFRAPAATKLRGDLAR